MAQQKPKNNSGSKAKAAATRAENKRKAEFRRQLRAVTQLLFGLFLLCCMVAGLVAPQKPIGGVVGGFVGAKLLSKLTFGAIHKIFGLFMIAAAVRMVFF